MRFLRSSDWTNRCVTIVILIKNNKKIYNNLFLDISLFCACLTVFSFYSVREYMIRITQKPYVYSIIFFSLIGRQIKTGIDLQQWFANRELTQSEWGTRKYIDSISLIYWFTMYQSESSFFFLFQAIITLRDIENIKCERNIEFIYILSFLSLWTLSRAFYLIN